MNASYIEKLKHVNLFSPLKDDPVALQTVAAMLELRSFKSGQAIIKEGEEGDLMFILYRGAVDICKNTLAKELYTVTKLTAENNAFFGELALVDNDRRSATVVASSDCDLLVMKKESFLKFGDQNPALGLMITRNVCKMLGQRLRRANQDMVTLYEALVGEIEENT